MTVVKQNVVSGPVNSTGVITAFFNRRERRTNRRSTAVTLPCSWQRLAATLAAVVAARLCGVATFAPFRALAKPITSPKPIKKLAADAYVWGVVTEFVYRFTKYNELVTAPVNAFGGTGGVAAWHNQATNAGNPSALYLNAMLDLSGAKGRGGAQELVLTVPPSKNNYYIVNLLDGFINTVGSIGTRTTPPTRANVPARRPDLAVRPPAYCADPRLHLPADAVRHEPRLGAHPDSCGLARAGERSHLRRLDPEEHRRAIASRIRGSELRGFEGGHGFLLQDPAASSEVVT